MFDPLDQKTEALATEIVDIAVKIHKQPDPGLLESVYESCFVLNCLKEAFPFKNKSASMLSMKKLVISDALRIDILVNNQIIIELKAQENFHPVWEAQLLSFLKLGNKRLGFLINYHVPLMKNGVKRLIL